MGQRISPFGRQLSLRCGLFVVFLCVIALKAEEESDFEFDDVLELRRENVGSSNKTVSKTQKVRKHDADDGFLSDFLSDETGSTPDGFEGSGSGFPETAAPVRTFTPPVYTFEPVSGEPEYFRITINITSVTYIRVLEDRNSTAFLRLAAQVEQSIAEEFRSISGQQTATVVQFRPGTMDPDAKDSIIATLDFATRGFYDRLMIFNVFNSALNRGMLGSLRVSPHGFGFRPFDGPSCPSTIGREPTSLPRLTDTKASLMVNNRFMCDGTLTQLSYFRGSLTGSFYVGIWRQVTEDTYLLRHRIEIHEDSVGIHNVLLDEPVPFERGDFLGIHYPRNTPGAIIVYSIPADNVLPKSDMFQTIVVDAYDEDLSHDETIDVKRFSSDLESRTFALLGFLSSAQPGKCGPHEFHCADGQCIEGERKCDKLQDCSDGSDEVGCTTACKSWQFHCDNGWCIELANVCNGQNDCGDYSDEINCEASTTHRPLPVFCDSTQFACADGKRCVDLSRKCDDVFDCDDESDEDQCEAITSTVPPPLTCDPHTEFTCGDGTCVDISGRCDRTKYDCRDGSDERDCVPTTVAPRICDSRSEFRCDDGTCIAISGRCDRTKYDCEDGSDELIGCDDYVPPAKSCDASHQFTCSDGTCIERRLRCDGYPSCRDESDEIGCAAQRCDPSHEFTCGDGSCVDRSHRCDGRYDCNDYSDEEDCKTECNPTTEFTCGDGKCIDISGRCDRAKYDCDDGSDERNCEPTPPVLPDCDERTEFTCGDGACIDISGRCDRTRYDCRDGSDELDGCDDYVPENVNSTSVPRGCDPRLEFTCGDGTCVDISGRCDRTKYDCEDGSDERNCGGVEKTTVAPRDCDSRSEFRCDDGTCVDISGRCDRTKYDCEDGSDELRGCDDYVPPAKPCDASRQFTCSDGTCIERSLACDGYPDCRDESDEVDCVPTTLAPRDCDSRSEFRCDDGTCIDISGRCDRTKYDCEDGSDELRGCDDYVPPAKPCDASHQFTCSDGACIERRLRCNGRPDCRDESDEVGCRAERCDPSHEFTCGDGSCIDRSHRCDGKYDCNDYSDEEDCHCLTGQFRCANGQCIVNDRRCDGARDCSDGSDERDCVTVSVSVSPSQLKIRVGREATFVCRVDGASDTETEWSRTYGALPPGARITAGRLEISSVEVHDSGEYICTAVNAPGRPHASARLIVEDIYGPTTTPRPRPGGCGANEAACSNGACVPEDYICDGDYDCTDRSDEQNCSIRGNCEPNEFQCTNGKCILKIWRCDKENDCSDNSDEIGCEVIPRLGTPCHSNEFNCTRGGLCIPAAYQCDGETDCPDLSDETSCSAPTIIRPPPRELMVELGQTITIECQAIGVPAPLIVWRLNWGHVGEAPRTTEVTNLAQRGQHVSIGVITIRGARKEDEGAYTCEALNRKGSILAVPDTIVHVIPPHGVCRSPYFNDEAHSTDDCVECFCFGVSQDCASSRLHLSEVTANRDVFLRDYRSKADFARNDIVSFDVDQREFSIRDYGRHVTRSGFYWTLPRSFLGDKITSYGGKLSYRVYYESRGSGGRLESGPDLVLHGNEKSLYHSEIIQPFSGIEQNLRVSLIESAWTLDEAGRSPSTRADLMMVLQNLEYVMIKSYYERNQGEVRLGSISMTTAVSENTGRGRASLVEACQCPAGYAGTSCEKCHSGFFRQKSGRYLGQCVPCECNGHSEVCEPETGACIHCRDYTLGPSCSQCASGYYRVQGPRSGGSVECVKCPCPSLSRRADVEVAECEVLGNGDVKCVSCPDGYGGLLCNECEPGFEKIDNICQPAGVACDPRGSTGHRHSSTQCNCKSYATGPQCNRCQESSFHLSEDNPEGCLPCFCMDVTKSCTSSTWYRSQIRLSALAEDHGLVLTDENRRQNFTEGVTVDSSTQEVVYRDSRRRRLPADLYWLLPSKFLGNKITSYGGYLHYTERNWQPSAYKDVKISGNRIELQHRLGQHEQRSESFRVKFSEQHWTSSSGRQASRDDLMIALSHLDYIMIKAADGVETRIGDVILDSADRRNTGLERAYAVEECVCPVGRKGLSCESCDTGYWRRISDVPGTCEPCNCHGHSDTCDPNTGICTNCQHNTEGDHCNVCARGYYGDATGRSRTDCLPCPCPLTHSPNQFSPTCILDYDGLVTCTACPPGHTGRRCESCLHDYVGNPAVHGDYCRPSSKQEDIVCDYCDDAGTIPNTQCDISTARCQCKTYVEGRECSECRPGYFHLSYDNPQGCLSCYCSGMTRDCTSSSYSRSKIEPDYVESHGFRLTNRRLSDQIDYEISADYYDKELYYEGFSQVQKEKESLYWNLPSKFTGSQVASYGGFLTFDLDYTLFRRESAMYLDADVELISGDNRFYLFLQPPPEPDTTSSYNISLTEASFRQLDGSNPSRETFLKALAALDTILIRATHYSYMSSATLGRLAMDTAVAHNTHQRRASEVEQCTCPRGYAGLSCERCDAGFSRVPDPSLPLGRCVECDCNNHSLSCDLNTGACRDCQDHTTGDRCDRCANGYYGDAKRGTSDDCRPCPCPLTSEENRFSATCFLNTDGQPTCDRCLPGYTGRQCERCADGYVGNPSIPGESCVKSSEGSKPRVSVSPKRHQVSVGGEASIRCNVHGQGPVRVQWIRSDGRPLPGRAVVSADHTLVLKKVESTDEGRYICIANSRYGKSQDEVSLTVSVERRLHVVVNQPKQLTASLGRTVQFNCTGYSQYAYTLAWSREDGQLLPSRIGDDGHGILTIRDVQASDAGTYVCTGSNAFNVASDRGVLEITEDLPVVRIEPKFARVESGEFVEFQCIATGSPVPRIRWSGGPGGRMPNDAIIGDDGTLQFVSVSSLHSGDYRCTASNYYGEDHATAKLEVHHEATIPPFEIFISDSEVEVSPGSEARISCSARGNRVNVDRIEWTKERGPLPSGSYQRNGQLVIPECRPADGGKYICTIYLVNGEKQVAHSTLVISPDDYDYELPVVEIFPSTMKSVNVGASALFQCLVTRGTPSPTISWARADGRPLGHAARVHDGSLELVDVTVADGGSYVCTGTNSAGSSRATILVNVLASEDIELSITPRELRVRRGETVEFRCTATGHPAPTVRWSRVDGDLPRNHQEYSGTLRLISVEPEDAGDYICIGRNSGGTADETVTLIVEGGPLRVSLQPSTQTLRPGDLLRLTCSVRHPRTVHLEWTKVLGQLSPYARVQQETLEIASVTANDAGRYKCQARDDQGQTAEAYAEVTLLVPPSAVISPRTVHRTQGQSVEFTCDVTGSPSPRIQWNREGQSLPVGHRTQGNKLLLSNVQPRDAGRYICTVANNVGTTRDYAQLSVTAGNGNGGVQDQQTVVTVGDRVVITCEVIGDIPRTVSWVRIGGKLPASSEIDGTLLILPSVELTDQGTYQCQASNHAATVYAQVTIIVQGPPLVTVSRQTKAVAVGSNVTIICQAGGSPTPSVTWSRRGGQLPRRHTVAGNSLFIVNLQSEDYGDYVCLARNSFGSAEGIITLQESVAEGVLRFSQVPLSYQIYPGIRDAYTYVDFEISFKPEALDGLLLYNGQSARGKDFLSFGLRDGRVEFQFNAGEGPVTVESDLIGLDTWHTARAKKNGKYALLVVDGKEYRGQVTGRHVGLDLAQDLYLGGVPDFRRISNEARFSTNFIGCVSRLIIGGTRIRIGEDAVTSVGVSECPVCRGSPCRNGGSCQSSSTKTGYQCQCTNRYSGLNCELVGTRCERDTCGSHRQCHNLPDGLGYKCVCPLNKSGPNCEHGSSVNIPSFNRSSYVAYPTMEPTLTEMQIELTFNPRSLEDAILLYDAIDGLGSSDFIAIIIKNEHVEFKFNLGSGPAIIKSVTPLKIGEWTTVVATLRQRDGSLVVNGGKAVTGRSSGTTVGLNLRTPMYVGGVDLMNIRLAPDVSTDQGFYGCISTLKIKGRLVDLANGILDSKDVSECIQEFHEGPCSQLSPCKNGGSCQDLRDSFRCICRLGFTGDTCDHRTGPVTSVQFSGNSSYVELLPRMLPHSGSREEVITLVVATEAPHGILLWQGQVPKSPASVGKDYIALSIEDGLVVFRYELGSGPAEIISREFVDDGFRHEIIVKRSGQRGSLIVDDDNEVTGESGGKMTGLDANGPIYLGGLPDSRTKIGGKHVDQFVGCISDIYFQSRGPLDFAKDSERNVNVTPCEE